MTIKLFIYSQKQLDEPSRSFGGSIEPPIELDPERLRFKTAGCSTSLIGAWEEIYET